MNQCQASPVVLKQSLGDAGVQDLAAATLMRGSTTDSGPVRPVDRGVHHSVVEAVVAVSDAENVTSVSSVADESQSLSCSHGKPPRHMLCYSTSVILSYVCLSHLFALYKENDELSVPKFVEI